MNDEIQKLKQEIDELKRKVEYTDDWVGGMQMMLTSILPFVLRDHPQVEKVAGLLKSMSDTYERLEQNPDSATEYDQPLATYEPGKMLYRVFAQMGVWPNVDAQTATHEALERARKR